MYTPGKVEGTKHRASLPLQKVEGKCPPVHPRIYAHLHNASYAKINCRNVFTMPISNVAKQGIVSV